MSISLHKLDFTKARGKKTENIIKYWNNLWSRFVVQNFNPNKGVFELFRNCQKRTWKNGVLGKKNTSFFEITKIHNFKNKLQYTSVVSQCLGARREVIDTKANSQKCKMAYSLEEPLQKPPLFTAQPCGFKGLVSGTKGECAFLVPCEKCFRRRFFDSRKKNTIL